MFIFLKLIPVEDLSDFLRFDGSQFLSAALLSVLDGEPGDGGVFDCEVAGEWEVEYEGFRREDVIAVGSDDPMLNGLFFIWSTAFEFDRRKRDLIDLEWGLVGCDGGAAASGGLLVFGDIFLAFALGGDGVAAVLMMSGLAGVFVGG